MAYSRVTNHFPTQVLLSFEAFFVRRRARSSVSLTLSTVMPILGRMIGSFVMENLMNTRRLLLVGAFFCSAALPSSVFAGEKIGDRLGHILQQDSRDSDLLIWVYFADKGSSELKKAPVPLDLVSSRSIQRRLKVRAPDNVVDYDDLPIEQSYVDQVSSLVKGVRQRSKWLNAISAEATKEQVHLIESLPFVSRIEVVGRYKRDLAKEQFTPENANKSLLKSSGENMLNGLDYGPSLGQLTQINVPLVHGSGNSAQGVIVGVFDNGFRLLNHQAFDSLRSRIIATHDFVDHKVSVAPNNPSSAYGSHGVNTLSTIGGYRPGNLIGPAFAASFILARTENDSSETPVEEDNWVAAIEWADSLGVEVTSTSLGYLDYQFPYASWTWQNMDGNTTAITRAADKAVGKGIVVVNSAGNDASNGTPNTLIAPADGKLVIAAGAVNPDGTRSSFSSYGPTFDGRIKPDVMAPGSSVVVASSTDTAGYGFQQGTSFSCPLVAGAAALMLHAKPDATPAQITTAMHVTASRASSPDNFYGWGIVNTQAAIDYLIGGGPPPRPTAFQVEQNYPNPFNSVTTIRYLLPRTSNVVLKIYDVLGREVRTLVNGRQSEAAPSVVWDGTDNARRTVASGVYFYRVEATPEDGSGKFTAMKKMIVIK